jgi:hypothetical protein
VSQGWPAILSRLKTMLETGDVSPWPAGDQREVAAVEKLSRETE